MDKAKAAVSEFLHDNNKHSVDIHQKTNAPVTHERLQRAEHENVTTAYDRERHQDHHQIHVQPLHDRVVDAEVHSHHVAPVEHREKHHGKDAEVARALDAQSKQFVDTQEVLPTQRSQAAQTLVGEHVHHHIHDTIQPVVEREHLQQHVVHTTVPIHETIHEAPVIHSGNVLPSKSLADWKAEGGHNLTGARETHEQIKYEGEPLNIKDNSSVGFDHATRHEGLGTHGRPGELGTATGIPGTAGIEGGHLHQKTTSGPHNSNVANKLDPRVDSDRDGSRTVGNTTSGTGGMMGGHGTGSTLTSGTGGIMGGHGTGNTMTSGTGGILGSHGTGNTMTSGTGPHTSGMANKLDPRVDSNGPKGMGSGYSSGTTGTSSGIGENITHKTTPRTHDSGYGNTSGTGLGSGTTGVSERATADDTVEKTSTTEKLLQKVGLGSKS